MKKHFQYEAIAKYKLTEQRLVIHALGKIIKIDLSLFTKEQIDQITDLLSFTHLPVLLDS